MNINLNNKLKIDQESEEEDSNKIEYYLIIYFKRNKISYWLVNWDRQAIKRLLRRFFRFKY